jgi:long-chain acyl-CoA synthetase
MQQELLLGELTRQGLTIYPSRPALFWRDQELTYLGLNGFIDMVAAGFIRQGVQRGDRVALYTHNLPHFIQAYYALARLGAIAVPINIHWKGQDLKYLLETVGVVGVVTIVPLFQRVQELRRSLPSLKWVVAITAGGPQPPNSISWEELIGDTLAPPVETRDIEGFDPALIAYSAGMSGPPKPAVLSHFNLLANCEQIEDMSGVTLCPPTTTDPRTGLEIATNNFEVSLLPLPLTDLFCLNTGLNLTLKLGGTAVLMERFEPDQALDLIERHKCTLIFGSPAIFSALVASPRFVEANLGSLKYAFCFGGPLPEEIHRAFYDRTGKLVFMAYGAVEASPVISCSAAGPRVDPLGAGYPLGVMQVQTVARGGNVQAPGQPGFLVAQGPNIMLGYFDPNNPDGPVTPLQNGVFNTGDIAQFAQDGSFYIIERREDLVVVQGQAVYPRQIESVLLSHPAVKEAAALALRDEYGGSTLVAFMVPQTMPPGATESELMLHCRKNLPAYACPTRIYLYEDGPELPRLPDGRIWRRPLREQAATMPK